MSVDKESPEERRERLRQEDLRKNRSSAYNGGGLQDLAGGMGWKGAGLMVVVIILLLFIGYFVFN